MPIPASLFEPLRNADAAAVQRAHMQLLQDGYAFVGYHGTNVTERRSLVPYGFDPSRIGSGGGIARGSGFYVAMAEGHADDYASEATQAGDPLPPHYMPNLKSGEAGQDAVLRIYARHFDAMRLGTDYAWGVQSRAGDPNGDLNVSRDRLRGLAPADTTRQLKEQAHDLEIVFSPAAYARLAAMRSRAFSLGDRPNLPTQTRPTRSQSFG